MKPNHFKDLEQYDYSKNIYYLENSKMYLKLRQLILKFQPRYVHSILGKDNIALRQWIYDSLPLLQDDKYNWSTRCYWIMFGIHDFPKCYFDDCNVVFNENIKFSIGYPTCCRKCNNRKDSPRTQHARATNYERVGSYTNMGTEQFKQQAIEGFLRNYGETNNMKSERGLKEYQDAIEKEYGVRNLFLLDDTRQNAKKAKKKHELQVIQANIMKNQHVSLITDITKYDSFKIGKSCWWQCLDCGHVFYGPLIAVTKEYITECPFCKFEDEYENHKFNHSYGEYEIVDFIRQTYPTLKVLHNTKENRKIISPKEIDIYLPDLKIGIEYDGCYWHQSKSYDDENKLMLKTELCEQKGIHLIHIYEDEWADSREFTKALLSFFIEKQKLDTGQFTTIVLPRDKFPIFYRLDGFELKTTIPPHLLHHYKFQMYDCGQLFYQRIQRVNKK